MRTSSEAKKAAALAKAAPDIRADQMEEINAAFDHYIFRIRRTGEVWTSCCRRHEHISREQGEAFAAVLDAPHHCGDREYATHYRYCHCGMISAPPPKEPDLVKCPFCGRMAKVKELGRCGKRQNLHQWTRGVVLRQYRGSLWAIAYDAAKDYEGPDTVLTDLPELFITKVYRFRAGVAERAGRWFASNPWQSYELLNKMPVKLPIPFHEPFNNSAEYGMSYDVIGAEELKKSAFRFCQVEAYIKNGHASDLMRVLALCTQRPRHVEMLTRAGMTGAVTDVAGGVRWNAAAINWKSSDPVEALGLDKEERKDFLNTGRSLKVLGAYKRMRSKGIPAEMTALEIMRIKVSDIWFDRLISAVCACGLKLEKAEAYLNREIKAGKLKRFGEAVELWVDYISAAKVLGYDLSNPVFATPKGLKAKHDRANEAAIHVRRLKDNSERAKKEGARQAALCRRYTFATERWLIRPPVGADEIVAEGKALCHCVGGYADRHVNGRTTILFLRDRKAPEKPLCTIEMRGNEIVQIHGYRDDIGARVKPRTKYKEILDPWLEWVAAGSKRDKLGRPKLSKKMKEENVA